MTRHSKTRALEQDPDFCDWLRDKYKLANTISSNPNCYMIRDSRTGRWRISETTQINTGYHQLSVYYNGVVRGLLWHRVVWFLTYGSFPDQTINHIDFSKGNNHPSNLEAVSLSANVQHSRKRTRRFRYTGILLNSCKTKPFSTTINVNGYRYHIGSFATEEQAAKAWDGYVTQHGLNRELNF